MEKHIVSFLVQNHPGVLYRISGLFRRKGYNIDSITVGVTTNPDISRITIVVRADNRMLEQVINQLKKCIDVYKVKMLNRQQSVFKEVALIKVKVDGKKKAALMETIDSMMGSVVDVGQKTFTVQFTGSTEQIDEAVDVLESFGVVELARTGLVAVERGDGTIVKDG